MKKISTIGEWGLIDKIIHSTQKKALMNNKIIVPNGDDAFVAKMSSKKPIVISTDTLLEGTHFNLNWLSNYFTLEKAWQYIGKKAISVNLSDLSAMGNVSAKYVFVTLGLVGDISVDYVDNFYEGVQYLMRKCGYLISGGDIIRSEKSIVSITVVGELNSSTVLRRTGAKLGDFLMVSGPIGRAAAGLDILKNNRKLTKIYNKMLVEAHINPIPQIEVGKILADKSVMATSALDTSDDLITSLNILQKKSKVGIKVDLTNLPTSKDLLDFCAYFKLDPLDFVLYGGEDYQILFTIHPSKLKIVQKRIPSAFKLGEICAESKGIRIESSGKKIIDKKLSYQHFKI